jgi:anti-sigma factor RsiW
VLQRKSGPQASAAEVERLLADGERLRRRSEELAKEAIEIEHRLADLYGTGSLSDRRKNDRRRKPPRLRGK